MRVRLFRRKKYHPMPARINAPMTGSPITTIHIGPEYVLILSLPMFLALSGYQTGITEDAVSWGGEGERVDASDEAQVMRHGSCAKTSMSQSPSPNVAVDTDGVASVYQHAVDVTSTRLCETSSVKPLTC